MHGNPAGDVAQFQALAPSALGPLPLQCFVCAVARPFAAQGLDRVATQRGYMGTFSHLSANHIGRYVAEFAGRHNIRDKDTIAQSAGLRVRRDRG